MIRWPIVALVAVLSFPGEVRADYIDDVVPNPMAPFNSFKFVYPNWTMLPTSSFSIMECDDVLCAWCLTSNIIGVTMMNYGTATGGPGADIAGMYFITQCDTSKSAMQAMTFAGNWTIGTDTWPAWTWAGLLPWINDPCDTKNGCGCSPSLLVYTDIGSCPTDGNTIALGPGYNDIDFGGVTDDCDSTAPWAQITDGNPKYIEYVTKSTDKDTIAPGDTINYTIYVGKPGTSYTNLVVMDSQPPYTHLVPGSAVPAADIGYDPDPGPPARLRWTMPAATSAGGVTQEIRFAVTVDWGNASPLPFDPDSGAVGAPEGEILKNNAQAFWPGMVGCSTVTTVTPPALTTVRRFLFWMIGSNDILFAPRIGLPDDEMTYEIFIRNASSSKGWWNVQIWDTVPAQYDVWSPGYGLDDPCTGWTMTPSGCSIGAAGKLLTGAKGQYTLLTWKIDLPPGMTMALRWNARVSPDTAANSTAINMVSVMELGKNMVGGSGSSLVPAIFTHTAPIILRTTYLSYLAIAGGTSAWFECCEDDPIFATQTYYISFYPLNRMTNFSLYEQVHQLDAYANFGGASPTISVYAGDCVTVSPAWIPGCGAERAPSFYKPVAYSACPAPYPMHDLFKLVANSPLTWEMLTADIASGSEVSTYCPTTSLTYRGYGAYSYARSCFSGNPLYIDGFFFVNTSTAGSTTIHVFSWDATTMTWQYLTTSTIDRESVWFFLPPKMNSYKFISSDYPVIIQKGIPDQYSPEFRTMAPQAETGTLVSATVPCNFYAFAMNDTAVAGSMYVGNMGAVPATYNIYQYVAANTTLPIQSIRHQTAFLVGNSGNWKMVRSGDVAPAGQLNPLNPHAYQQGYDTGAIGLRTFYKVKLLSGGPIQVQCGYRNNSSYDGAMVLHASDGNQSGYDFWLHNATWENFAKSCGTPFWANIYFDCFVPKKGTMVKAFDLQGYSAAYTTDGQDECVAFSGLTPPAPGDTRNWRFQSTGGIIAVAMAHTCLLQMKMYTGPFVSTGVHYDVIAPPIVYVGQSFWITVVVLESAGGTKTDYDGVTSFTSTDGSAMIGGLGMDTYNYAWVPATNNGVKIFFNVIINKLGMQTIIASDTVDGSIIGMTALMVVGVDVKMFKEERLTIAASGDTIRFKICWSAYSSASAFTFVITDAVPVGTAYVPEVASAMNCGSTDGATMAVAYSNDTTTPAATWTTVPSAAPPLTTRWLRWTVPVIGVQTTGCACFKVSIN